MRLPLLTTLPLIALSLAAPAQAQSQLERFEELSEQAAGLMNEGLIAQVPALEGNLPSPEWDDELRTAFSCVLDGYRDASSNAEIDVMLEEMEEILGTVTAEELMAGDSFAHTGLPGDMTEEQGFELMQSCGVMAIYMARMSESGAMAIMMEQ